MIPSQPSPSRPSIPGSSSSTQENWPEAYGRTTIKRIGEVFRMEGLTLGEIKRAMEYLNRK